MSLGIVACDLIGDFYPQGRVLPDPPAPVKVTNRLCANSLPTSISCGPRPIKLVNCRGRYCVATLLAEVVTQIGMTQLHHPLRTGQHHAARGCPDRSATRRLAVASMNRMASVVPDSTVWPP